MASPLFFISFKVLIFYLGSLMEDVYIFFQKFTT